MRNLCYAFLALMAASLLACGHGTATNGRAAAPDTTGPATADSATLIGQWLQHIVVRDTVDTTRGFTLLPGGQALTVNNDSLLTLAWRRTQWPDSVVLITHLKGRTAPDTTMLHYSVTRDTLVLQAPKRKPQVYFRNPKLPTDSLLH